MRNNLFKVRAKVWVYPGPAPWHFITVPSLQSTLIKSRFGKYARGWRSLPVRVTLGRTSWKTSIFPDKEQLYMLPIKIQVRNAEGVEKGNVVALTLEIRDT